MSRRAGLTAGRFQHDKQGREARMAPQDFIAKWGAPDGVPDDDIWKGLLALNLAHSVLT